MLKLKKQAMLALFLAFVALLLARRPARADPAADLLVQVRSQVDATKAETAKIAAKARADAAKAQKVVDETRGACQDLITAAAELFKVEIEAKARPHRSKLLSCRMRRRFGRC